MHMKLGIRVVFMTSSDVMCDHRFNGYIVYLMSKVIVFCYSILWVNCQCEKKDIYIYIGYETGEKCVTWLKWTFLCQFSERF